MSKSVKFTNNVYVDSSGITHNRELLSSVLDKTIRFKKFEIEFDVSNAKVGEWIVGHTTNNIPGISGMQVVGFIVYYIGYGDKNFVLSPQWRGNKVYAKLFLGYKEGKDEEITLNGYIVYANPSIVDDTSLT